MVYRFLSSKKLLILFLLIFGQQVIVKAQTTDSDNDGVADVSDYCPNTPVGTTVNAYGCPVSLSTCDYTTSSFSFVSGSVPSTGITKYILADALDGKIVQISNTPSFLGLVITKTYMVLAFSYINDGSLVNLTTNNYINQVTANCSDWSNAMMVKVCPTITPGNNCDYTTSSITINTTTPPSGATTKYVLASTSGVILQISNTPTFSNLSGSNNYNVFAISYTDTVNNLAVGNNISDVTGNCYDWSDPLPIKVCVCKPVCLPVTIVRNK